jgi:hypothetical protein
MSLTAEELFDGIGASERFSGLVLCCGGRVVRELPFRIERDTRTPLGTSRPWVPSE